MKVDCHASADDQRREKPGLSEGWTDDTLSGLVKLRRGHDLTERARRAGDVPVVGSAGINGFHDTALVSGPGVVLGRSGASFGQAHYVPSSFWPHNTALYVTDFLGNDPKFIYYLLGAIDFTSHNSGGAQQSLNRNFIAEVPVRIPTHDEQTRIAGALRDADALIESLEQLLAKKRQLKQGAMQELLTGKRRLPGFVAPWQRMRFADLAQPRRDRVAPAAGSQCVDLESIEPKTGRLLSFTEAGESSSQRVAFRRGDVLFGKLRAYLRKHWLAEFDGACSTEFWALAPNPATTLSQFVFQVAKTDRFIEAASASYGTHMPRSDWKVVSKFELPCPPREEQSAIATVLSTLDAELEALEARLAKARALKQGMAQALLTGRIRLASFGEQASAAPPG